MAKPLLPATLAQNPVASILNAENSLEKALPVFSLYPIQYSQYSSPVGGIIVKSKDCFHGNSIYLRLIKHETNHNPHISMKTTLSVSLAILAISLASCTNKKQSENIQVPSFPYESYLVQIQENGCPPIIGDDGNGFNAISHKIRYPEIPDTLNLSPFADSLLLMYNTCLAFNTMAYDVSTAERYMEEDDTLRINHANALDSINLSGIRDKEIRDALMACSKKVAEYIKSGIITNVQETSEVSTFHELFNRFCDSFLEAHLSEAEFDPSTVLENYEEIHQKAITDTLSYRQELLKRVCGEVDFQKKCVLAREFAYANYRNPAGDDRELIAVIDPILRTNNYSPLLGELWLIWRTALQAHVFGSISNYGAMYNLFYNDMRNRVALQYITHLNSHPSDKVAFDKFCELAFKHNITRNSRCLIGNNSFLDQMSIYEGIRYGISNTQNNED